VALATIVFNVSCQGLRFPLDASLRDQSVSLVGKVRICSFDFLPQVCRCIPSFRSSSPKRRIQKPSIALSSRLVISSALLLFCTPYAPWLNILFDPSFYRPTPRRSPTPHSPHPKRARSRSVCRTCRPSSLTPVCATSVSRLGRWSSPSWTFECVVDITFFFFFSVNWVFFKLFTEQLSCHFLNSSHWYPTSINTLHDVWAFWAEIRTHNGCFAFGVMLVRSSRGVVGNEIVSQIHIGYTFRHRITLYMASSWKELQDSEVRHSKNQGKWNTDLSSDFHLKVFSR